MVQSSNNRNCIRACNTKVYIRTEGDAHQIGGIAAPFNDEITFQGQKEVILPTAFDLVLSDKRDVRLFVDHSYKVENLLATRSSGNLELTKTPAGLGFLATLPTPLTDKSQHLLSLARQGALGASVGWARAKEKFINGVRNFSEIDLTEISITPIPAYKNTIVEQRKIDQNAWVETFQTILKANNRRFRYTATRRR